MRVSDWVISRWFKERGATLRWCRSWRAGVLLLALGLTVYLPGLFTIPPIDRDESRFAQASRQMFESAALPAARQDPTFHSGGWVVPMVQDRPRLNKPPLVYWLQVASAWAFTGGDPLKDEIWMYRIPGVLCALATVLMTWRLGCSMFDPRAAVVGAALLAVCPLVVFDAHQARADQLLLTTVVGMQWGLWGVWRRANASTSLRRARGAWLPALAFWIWMGASVLAKGPIGPMVAGLTVLALCLAGRTRRWIWSLRPVVGVVIVAAMVGPWLYGVGEHVGWSRYISIIVDETIGRSVEPKEGHWGPPGYHTVLLAVLFWPGSLTTAMAVGRAFKRGFPANPERERRAAAALEKTSGSDPPRPRGVILRLRHASAHAARRVRDGFAGRSAELFLLAWIVPAWVVFELIGTKLPHYTMPMYPAVALVSARCLLALAPARFRINVLDRLGAVAWSAIGVVIAVVTFFGLLTLNGGHLQWKPPAVVWGAAWLVLAATAMGFAAGSWRGAWIRASAIAVLHIIVASGYLLGLVFPLQTDELWLTPKVARWIEGVNDGGVRNTAAVSYQEDSLIFELRGRVQRVPAAELRAWIAAHPTGLVVLSQDAMREFPELRTARFGRADAVGAFNYARGRRETVLVAERAP